MIIGLRLPTRHAIRRLAGWALVVGAAVARGSHAAAQEAPAGQLVPDTLHSRALEHNLYGDTPDRPMLVYLPPGYGSTPMKRYPVVYLLHGFGGNERTFATAGRIKPTMDSLIALGSVREMIIVMPNGRNVFAGSFYTNSASAGNWDDFVAKELVAYIDGKYRTLARPESRGLGGHSMGGYGAFVLGMRHAGDVYGALYSLSGCCTHFSREPGRSGLWDSLAALPNLAAARRLSFIPLVSLAMSAAFSPNPSAAPLFVSLPFVRGGATTEVVDSVYAKWINHAPLDMIPSHADRLKRLRGFMFDVGLSDDLVSPASQMAIDSALTRAGVRHTFETYDGDHMNRLGSRVATRLLPFFSRTLDFGDGRSP
jgi:S-formylglutathione hydrolase